MESYLSLSGVITLVANMKNYIQMQISALVNNAPETLNTLNELSEAIGNDENFAATIANQIGLKTNDADLATVAKSGNINDLTQTDGDVIIFNCGTSSSVI